jgi:hypothetical protein
MSGGSYGRQQAEYHKNSHPGGDVIPMHECGEPSCLEATGREPPRNIAGRDQPRETEAVTHHVRFWGNLNSPRDVFAECDACHWSAGLEGGHDGPELMRLVRQHAGVVA